MKFIDTFCIEDQIIKLPGLYALWTAIFICNMVAFFVDNTTGAVRNFNIAVNGLSVIYPGLAGWNSIYGNGKPSSVLLIAGPIHQYLFWMLFGYFGGSDVLSSSELGVMNWISLFVVGGFSVDMVLKSWFLSLKRQEYLDYVNQE